MKKYPLIIFLLLSINVSMAEPLSAVFLDTAQFIDPYILEIRTANNQMLTIPYGHLRNVEANNQTKYKEVICILPYTNKVLGEYHIAVKKCDGAWIRFHPDIKQRIK